MVPKGTFNTMEKKPWLGKKAIKIFAKKRKIALQISNVSSTITLLDWINNDNANSIANGVQIATKQYPNNTVNKENIENTVKESK